MQFTSPLDFEHDVVVILDRSGFIRFITRPRKAYQEGVRAPDQLIGNHYSEFVHPEDQHLLQRWPDMLAHRKNSGGAGCRIMFRVRRPDDTWRWLEATQPEMQGNHVVDHVIFFLRDIAAHRLIEYQYRQAEEVAGCGVWNLPRNGKYAQLSAGMLRRFGYELGDPITERKFWPLIMVVREDTRRVTRVLRRAFEMSGEFSFTCTVRTKSGQRRTLKTRGHVRCDAVGRDTAFSVSWDITALHVAERRLRASEEQYRLLAQNTSDIICQLDPEGTIEFISPSVLKLTDRKPGRLTGLSFTTLLPESEHETLRSFLEQLGEAGGDVRCAVR